LTCIVFNKTGKLLDGFHFFYNQKEIEIVRKYCYLGIIFNAAGTFGDAVERLTDQARKALFKLQQKHLQNHVLTALKLFDVLIVPILSYCFEVWGPYYCKNLNVDNIFQSGDKYPGEKLHTKFCRYYLLGVHRKSCNGAVRAELGRRPLLLDLIVRTGKYWLTLCGPTPGSATIVNCAYSDLLRGATSSSKTRNWSGLIKHIWAECELSGVWENQGTKYKHKTICLLKSALYQIYDKSWWAQINSEDSKLRTYKTFKSSPFLENYILEFPMHARKEFTKLRISSHQLQIELGRYTRPRKTPVESRICKVCKGQAVETEEHFVMSCTLYSKPRKTFFAVLDSFTSFKTLSSAEQFIFVMSCLDGDTEIGRHVIAYINDCIELRQHTLSLSHL